MKRPPQTRPDDYLAEIAVRLTPLATTQGWSYPSVNFGNGSFEVSLIGVIEAKKQMNWLSGRALEVDLEGQIGVGHYVRFEIDVHHSGAIEAIGASLGLPGLLSSDLRAFWYLINREGRAGRFIATFRGSKFAELEVSDRELLNIFLAAGTKYLERQQR